MGIIRNEILGLGVDISEITASTAGDEDFLAALFGMLDDEHAFAAFAGFDGAHQSRCSCANYNHIIELHEILACCRECIKGKRERNSLLKFLLL